MKKIWPLFLALVIVFACSEDQYDENAGYEIMKDSRGEVSSYRLKNYSQGFTADEEFFDMILNTSEADQFRLEETGVTPEGVLYNRYFEYFEGISVKDGQYTLYRNNGIVVAAEGSYIRVGKMDAAPAIDETTVISVWCKALNTAVPDMAEARFKLMIITTDDNEMPSLVYRVYLRNIRPANSIIGFIDAASAQLLMTEPIYIF